MQKIQNKDTIEENREIFLFLWYVYVVSTCYVIYIKYFSNKIHYARFNEDGNEFYTIFYAKLHIKLVSHVTKNYVKQCERLLLTCFESSSH